MKKGQIHIFRVDCHVLQPLLTHVEVVLCDDDGDQRDHGEGGDDVLERARDGTPPPDTRHGRRGHLARGDDPHFSCLLVFA